MGRSIRTRLLLVFLLIALLLGGVVATTFEGWSDLHQRTLEDTMTDLSVSAAGTTGALLAAALRTEQTAALELAQQTTWRDEERGAFLRRLFSIQSEKFRSLDFVASDRVIRVGDSDETPAQIRSDPAVRAVASGRRWSLKHVVDKGGAGGIHLAVSVEGATGRRGILRGIVSTRWIRAALPSQATDYSYILILDSDAQVVDSRPTDWSDLPRGALSAPAVGRAIAGVPTEGASLSSKTGQFLIAAYAPVKIFGWAAAAVVDARLARAPIYREQRVTVIGTLVGLLLMFALFWSASGALLYAIQRMQRASQAIASGDVGYRVNMKTGTEMDSLRDAFNFMAERLQANQDLLRDRNQQLNVLLSLLEGIRTERNPQRLLRRITQDAAFVTRAEVAFLAQVDNDQLWLREWWDGSRWTSLDHHWVAGEGVPGWVWLHHDTRASVDDGARPAPGLEINPALDVNSYICSPIVVPGGAVAGVLFVGAKTEADRFTEDDVRIMELLARHAGVALQIQAAFERERRVGETMQKAMLPDIPPKLGGLSIARQYRAALDETELGGDFYDVIPLGPRRIGFVIADVSGKGLRAAVQTAAVKYALRSYALEDNEPSRVLSRVNAACFAGSLRSSPTAQGFVSLFYGVIDLENWEMRFANAGHQPPLLRRSDRSVALLHAEGVVLGVVDSSLVSFPTHVAELRAGDTLVLYTDGLSDARRDDDFLDTEGLQTLLGQIDGSAHETARMLLEAATTFAEGVLRDDVALLVIQVPDPLPSSQEIVVPMESSLEL
ncbi:MAG TPA: SpoIIE family protein phosphatase [Armatimonadota bacterium]|nr:SpoIIE family protein phosphatase [Armatimonadota bacterium]